MGRDNKISMPSGIGGLTRYFDEYRSKITIKPGHVVIICIVVILLLLFLQLRAG
ncbi:preprotein translocase subunit Sec61beta [Thermoproteota archaeon]